MAVEPWEYGAKEEKKEAPKGVPDFIYLGIFIIAGITAYFFYGKSMIYFWVASGTALGALIAVFSAKSSDAVKVLSVVAVPAVAFLIIMTIPSIPFAELQTKLGFSAVQNATNFTSSFSCLLDYSKCQQQYQTESYNPSSVPTSSRNRIDLIFQSNSIQENQPIDINADISVMNQDFDNFVVDAICYLDDSIQIIAEPPSFTFQKSSSEQNEVITCKGDYKQSKNLTVKLQSRYKSEAALSVSIGKGTAFGVQSSAMLYDSPYKLSISLNYDQPLRTAGNKRMPIILEKQGNMKIKELNSLKVSSNEGIMISCTGMSGNEINDLDRNLLKKYLIDPDKDAYSFKCDLVLDENDVSKDAQTSYIKSEAIYTAEAAYGTSLRLIK